MTSGIENRVGPADIAPGEQFGLERMLKGEVRPVLVSQTGDVVELPKALKDLFVSVVSAVNQKQAVFLMHEDEAFTTQAAANFLGISRQFFVRLLNEGKLPFHYVGSHRRVFFKDLVSYRRARSTSRTSILDRMTIEAVQSGLDDRVIDMTREDGD